MSEISKRVTGAIQCVSDRVDLLQHQRLGNVERTGLTTLRETRANREQTHINTDYLRNIDARLQLLQSRAHGQEPHVTNNVFFMMHPDMAAIMQTGLYRIVSEDQYIQREFITLPNSFFHLPYKVNQTVENHLWPEIDFTSRPRTPVYLLPPITKTQLLERLHLQQDDESHTDDLKYILRRNHSMTPRGLDQARSLMSKEAFKTLLATDKSAILMVNGHSKSEGAGKVNPLSVWSASFAASLAQSDTVVVLHFFCGLHSDEDSDDVHAQGPMGLARSLLGQLIHQADDTLRLGPLDTLPVNELQEGNINSILHLFKSLLASVDTGKTVFMIIDNVSEFEGMTWNGWSEEIKLIFTTFYDLIHDAGGDQEARTRPKVKVLMTSPNKSTSLGEMVAEDEVVALR